MLACFAGRGGEQTWFGAGEGGEQTWFGAGEGGEQIWFGAGEGGEHIWFGAGRANLVGCRLRWWGKADLKEGVCKCSASWQLAVV